MEKTVVSIRLYNVVADYAILEDSLEVSSQEFLYNEGKLGHPLTQLAVAVMEHADNETLRIAVQASPLSSKILRIYWDLSEDIRVEEWGWSERHLADQHLRVMKAAQIALNPLAYLQHVRVFSPEMIDFALNRVNDHIPGAKREILSHGGDAVAALGIDIPGDWGLWYHLLKQRQVLETTPKSGALSGAGSGTPLAHEPFYAVCPALESRLGPLQLGCYIMGKDDKNFIDPGVWMENILHPSREHFRIPERIREELIRHKVSTIHFHTMRHKTPFHTQFEPREARPEGTGMPYRFQLFTHHSVHEGAEGRAYDVSKRALMGCFEPYNVAPLPGDWHHPLSFDRLEEQEVYIHPIGGYCVMSPNTAGLAVINPDEEAHFWTVHLRDDGDERINAFVIENFVTGKESLV